MTATTITEAELQHTLFDAGRVFGWTMTHFRPGRSQRGWRTPLSGDRGFPDIVAARDGAVLALELKGDRGKLTGEQEQWRDALGAGRPSTLVWRLVRPDDLDAVIEELR